MTLSRQRTRIAVESLEARHSVGFRAALFDVVHFEELVGSPHETTRRRKVPKIVPKTIERQWLVNRQFEGITHGIYYPIPGYEPSVSDETVESWFDGLDRDTKEPGTILPIPSVYQEAKRIVGALRNYLPSDVDIYTMDEGKIAIEAFGSKGYGFLLICERDQRAVCLVTTKDSSRRARYENSTILPDGFLLEGLYEVVRSGQTVGIGDAQAFGLL